jgi:acyl-CoA synthetase (AMP-forming)/AMP-acid ligase II
LKPERIIKQIHDHQVESIASSPYFVLNLAKYALENDQPIKNIKRIFTGGASVFPEEAQSYVRAFPNATSKILYGSTEAEPISSVDAKELSQRNLTKDKGLFVGEIDASATVLIIPIEDRDLEFHTSNDLQNFSLAEGEIGEIIVSGSHVLKEYINNPEAMKRQKIWVEDICWHRTGDSGFRIGNELFLTGPCNALIQNENGFLSPFLYEEILKSINGVKTGTIVRIEDKNYAVIEIDANTDSNMIAKDLMAITSIDDVYFIEKIPRDPRHFSKIEYKNLKLILTQKLK